MAERKLKRSTLEKRLEQLEEKLYLERLRQHRVIDNIGWGKGMRCSRCTPSFQREDRLKERIEETRRLLAKYED